MSRSCSRTRQSKTVPMVAFSVAAAIGLGGCGGGGQFQYVKSAEAETYFKVPRKWFRFEERELLRAQAPERQSPSGEAFTRSFQWVTAFDAARKPSIEHLNFGGARRPTVYARVRELLPEESDVVSTETLRNLVANVDELEQQHQIAIQEDPIGERADPEFQVLGQAEIAPRAGLRGIRIVFDQKAQDGRTYTTDQTALVDDKNQLLYVLVIRCEAGCYDANNSLLNKIAESFTVKRD